MFHALLKKKKSVFSIGYKALYVSVRFNLFVFPFTYFVILLFFLSAWSLCFWKRCVIISPRSTYPHWYHAVYFCSANLMLLLVHTVFLVLFNAFSLCLILILLCHFSFFLILPVISSHLVVFKLLSFIVVCLFWEGVKLYCPGWPQTFGLKWASCLNFPSIPYNPQLGL